LFKTIYFLSFLINIDFFGFLFLFLFLETILFIWAKLGVDTQKQLEVLTTSLLQKKKKLASLMKTFV